MYFVHHCILHVVVLYHCEVDLAGVKPILMTLICGALEEHLLTYYFLQWFDTVGWVIWPIKPIPDMTYNVFSGTLNFTQSIISSGTIGGGTGCHVHMENMGEGETAVACTRLFYYFLIFLTWSLLVFFCVTAHFCEWWTMRILTCLILLLPHLLSLSTQHSHHP